MTEAVQQIQQIKERTNAKKTELEQEKVNILNKLEEIKMALSLAYAEGKNVDGIEKELQTTKKSLAEVEEKLEILEHSNKALRPYIDAMIKEITQGISELEKNIKASETKIKGLRDEYNKQVDAEAEARVKMIEEHNTKINQYQAVTGLSLKHYKQDNRSRLEDLVKIGVHL